MHVYIRTVTKGFYTKQLIQTRIETTVHGHHIYKGSWSSYIEEEVPVQCEVNNIHDDFAVAVPSGSWGCGAFFRDKWFQLDWAGNLNNAHISVKELVPITIPAAIWGPEWSTESIEVKCDNAAVVAVVNSGSTRNPGLMHLMRCLSFFMGS